MQVARVPRRRHGPRSCAPRLVRRSRTPHRGVDELGSTRSIQRRPTRDGHRVRPDSLASPPCVWGSTRRGRKKPASDSRNRVQAQRLAGIRASTRARAHAHTRSHKNNAAVSLESLRLHSGNASDRSVGAQPRGVAWRCGAHASGFCAGACCIDAHTHAPQHTTDHRRWTRVARAADAPASRGSKARRGRRVPAVTSSRHCRPVRVQNGDVAARRPAHTRPARARARAGGAGSAAGHTCVCRARR
jgi:hypothetical protein